MSGEENRFKTFFSFQSKLLEKHDTFLLMVFNAFAAFTYKFYWLIPFIVMGSTAILGSGISQLHVMDGREMFVDKDTWVEKDRDLYYKHFNQPFRSEIIYFMDKERKQLLTQQKLLQVQNFMISFQGFGNIPPKFVVNYENEKNLTYQNLCFQPINQLNKSSCVQTANVISMFLSRTGSDLLQLNDTQVVQRIRSGTPPIFMPLVQNLHMPAYIFPHLLFGSKGTTPKLVTIKQDGSNDIEGAEGTAWDVLLNNRDEDDWQDWTDKFEEELEQYCQQFSEDNPLIDVYAFTWNGPSKTLEDLAKEDLKLVFLSTGICILVTILGGLLFINPFLGNGITIVISMISCIFSALESIGFLSYCKMDWMIYTITLFYVSVLTGGHDAYQIITGYSYYNQHYRLKANLQEGQGKENTYSWNIIKETFFHSFSAVFSSNIMLFFCFWCATLATNVTGMQSWMLQLSIMFLCKAFNLVFLVGSYLVFEAKCADKKDVYGCFALCCKSSCFGNLVQRQDTQQQGFRSQSFFRLEIIDKDKELEKDLDKTSPQKSKSVNEINEQEPQTSIMHPCTQYFARVMNLWYVKLILILIFIGAYIFFQVYSTSGKIWVDFLPEWTFPSDEYQAKVLDIVYNDFARGFAVGFWFNTERANFKSFEFQQKIIQFQTYIMTCPDCETYYDFKQLNYYASLQQFVRAGNCKMKDPNGSIRSVQLINETIPENLYDICTTFWWNTFPPSQLFAQTLVLNEDIRVKLNPAFQTGLLNISEAGIFVRFKNLDTTPEDWDIVEKMRDEALSLFGNDIYTFSHPLEQWSALKGYDDENDPAYICVTIGLVIWFFCIVFIGHPLFGSLTALSIFFIFVATIAAVAYTFSANRGLNYFYFSHLLISVPIGVIYCVHVVWNAHQSLDTIGKGQSTKDFNYLRMENFMKRYLPLHWTHMVLGVISLIPLFNAKLYVFKIIAGVWVFAQLYSFLYSIFFLICVTTSFPLPSDYDNSKSPYFSLRRSGSSFSPQKKNAEKYNQRFQPILQSQKYKQALQRTFDNLRKSNVLKKNIKSDQITPQTNFGAEQIKITMPSLTEENRQEGLLLKPKQIGDDTFN